jgi:hypothetical protein
VAVMAERQVKVRAEKAGRQVRVRAAKVGGAVSVRLLSHAAKRQLPSKAAVTSTMMKAASRILIAKTQTVRL